MTPFTLTREQVRELDRRAIDDFGVPGVVLMENAGRGCAELLMRLNPERRPTHILCGPGNNGGDGFVIARHLDNHGWPVCATLIAHPERLSADAAVNLRPVEQGGIDLTVYQVGTLSVGGPYDVPLVLEQFFRTGGWVVDALFGTGLSRPLDSPYSEFADILNEYSSSVLAVDIPSGLDCDTGEPLGPTVRATHTATFVAPKRGFLNPESREWTGEVHVIDIGAPRVLVDEYRKGSG